MTTASITLTQARERDLPGISALAWPDPALARQRQERLHAWQAGGGLIVARADETVLAFAQFDETFFDHTFVGRLVVGEKYRRRGIGSALLVAITERAPTPAVFTSAHESNYPKRLMLDALGWENTGSVRGLDGDGQTHFYRAPGEHERAERLAG